jgi:hypothetical protein
VKITRLNPAKFRVGRYILNELEVRYLQLETAQGKREPNSIVITDHYGHKATINENGVLSAELVGMGDADNLALELHRVQITNAHKAKKKQALQDRIKECEDLLTICEEHEEAAQKFKSNIAEYQKEIDSL